jgi:galactokinase
MMDPLICLSGQRGRALLIDFSTLDTQHIPIPADAEFVIVDSRQSRTLLTSDYAARVAECDAAAAIIGPLGTADEADLVALADPVLRQRARHVISECRRVRRCATAFAEGDLTVAGTVMSESHHSLASDFAVSTVDLDTLVERLASLPGVYGARMTGAGFGGCAVALSRPGAVDLHDFSTPAWRVAPSDGTVALRR